MALGLLLWWQVGQPHDPGPTSRQATSRQADLGQHLLQRLSTNQPTRPAGALATDLSQHLLEELRVRLVVKGCVERQHRPRALQVVA